MNWIDIASILFVCVTMNHLGLVKAVEAVMERELPVINCVKCLTFWSELAYLSFTLCDIPLVLAISFLCSYLAIWLELFEGIIDTLYTKLYEKIYPNSADDTLTAADFDDDTYCAVS